MAGSNSPVYLVDPESDPVLIKIRGRASLHNSQVLRSFFQQSFREGRRRFIIDFQECVGMDSTFLGVLAGAAIDLRRTSPSGALVFCRLAKRNLELVRNLGLHRLATVDLRNDKAAATAVVDTEPKALKSVRLNEEESARLCLDAHQKLVEADGRNFEKFRDVITLLKDRLPEN